MIIIKTKSIKTFTFVFLLFVASSGVANIITKIFDFTWVTSSVEIEPFPYIYGYGGLNENKKCDKFLSFLSNNKSTFYLDENLLLPSNFLEIDINFFYNLRLNTISKAQFFDFEKNEYRCFILSPILYYYLNKTAYKHTTLVAEDYGTISYSKNIILINNIRIPFQGEINESNLKRDLELKLIDNFLVYSERFKLGNNNAIIQSEYSPKDFEYSFFEQNLFTKKILYYLMKVQFLGDRTLNFKDVLTASTFLDKKALAQINFVGDFFKFLSGNWGYCKSNQKINVKANTFLKPYVYLFFDFEKKDSIFFTDYVLEDEVLDFGIYSKDEFLSVIPKNRKYLDHLKYVDTGMTDFSNLEVKPFLILFFNPSELRLYLCKYNEVKFYKGKNINLSTYSSFYFYDIPFGKNIPLNIEWKTDYSNFNERNIIRSPRSLKWEISDDFSEIKEYRKEGENWVLQSTMKKVPESENKKTEK